MKILKKKHNNLNKALMLNSKKQKLKSDLKILKLIILKEILVLIKIKLSNINKKPLKPNNKFNYLKSDKKKPLLLEIKILKNKPIKPKQLFKAMSLL
jgi:hypothetical protein